MRRAQAVALALCWAACFEGKTVEDELRLGVLKEKFGQTYSFRLEEPVYLRVQSTRDAKPDIQALFDIFAAFWLNPDGKPRRDSAYVYLNAYDRSGTWTLQLYWDPALGKIVSSKGREHY